MVTLKFALLTICAVCAFFSLPNESLAFGEATALSGDELAAAVGTLETALSKLSTGDGPSYTISKVNSVSKQVVSGITYRYNVDLTDGDKNVNCNVQIWSRQWLKNGNQVTIDCSGANAVKFNY
ncbi:sarcocystatin-A isoform X4 [Bactrocera dorsalis]|uniref:Sarcocystatin-A isoform X4 n=1 Tax=Bactrocera dorsalis TaxID=27457 RepID=A0ABM3J1Q6_BACDO|nr:sarcocystatin-A isoform X4 [Bactrocera dorsalis]